MEETLVVVKPDGVQRNLIGKILSYYEADNLKITQMKLINTSKELIFEHYPEDEAYLLTIAEKGIKAGEPLDTREKQVAYGRSIVHGMRHYMTSGPVVAIILEGVDAVKRVRAITGFTDPTTAGKGTIRGDLGQDSIAIANKEKRPCRNLIHASGTPYEAEKEIKLWFPERNN